VRGKPEAAYDQRDQREPEQAALPHGARGSARERSSAGAWERALCRSGGHEKRAGSYTWGQCRRKQAAIDGVTVEPHRLFHEVRNEGVGVWRPSCSPATSSARLGVRGAPSLGACPSCSTTPS
jgi:hypothetical protein